MFGNKYGFFKYADVAFGAKEDALYSANFDLQSGSSLTQLSVGVEPYDYASFEEDAYDTSNPKQIYKNYGELGLLTATISDGNGYFVNPIKLTSNFDNYHTMTGLTINSRNLVLELEVIGYRDNVEVARKTLSAQKNNNFYEFILEIVNKVELIIKRIAEPYHFFGVYNIEYGAIRIFDDSTNVKAAIQEKYSIYGDGLEYNTLDLDVVDFEDKSLLFQRKQSIEYIVENEVKAKFFVEKGNEINETQISLIAYDEISNLEDDFYGGFYNDYPLPQLIDDIFEDKLILYEIDDSLMDIKVNGYLPVSSRRKALQTVMQGTNTRCLRKEKLYFEPVNLTLNKLILDESNILKNPIKTRKQEIKSVILTTHNYSKNKDETTEYDWYLSTTENTLIVFDIPKYDLKAYEVTGVDEDGNDIVSETQSKKVKFIETHPNYCIVSSTTTNKVVIVGKGYNDSTTEFKKENNFLLINNNYEEIKVDLTLTSSPQTVCDMLFDLYSRKNSIRFKSLENLELGGYYCILNENLNISSKYHNLNGIYEYEAV